ncbi:hypothetical protein MNR01_02340 [Lysobacter sp. S4-A87]|uniref:hypothetical protein n=1 Tax=Lysobacter sp. S4-A87 TaxID=2925843 RepID=UPI001F52F5D7|nr:hypothetical protein [Lysobacter sp. S4-A87]UNK49897.1 hypothetical protein MNR01_02340 [Lysobacter sp. S4-A87]
MDTAELEMDRALFSAEVLARTAHRYTDEYYVDLQVDADIIRVRLTPKRADIETRDLALRFRNDALDDRLRAAVAIQTGDLQTALVRAALAEARPRGQTAA